MSCETVGSAGWGEEEWAALKASKPSKLILIKALSKSLLLSWEERGGGGELRRGRDGVAERKTHPERKKQVAIVIIGIILPAFTITSGSQAHFSLSQTWEVSSTTSSILQTFQNINLMLENVKGLLRVIDKLGGRSDRI